MIKHTIQCVKCSEWGYCRSKYSQEGCLAKMMFHKGQKRIANLMCRRDSLQEELTEARTEIIKATADILFFDKKREQAEKALAEAKAEIARLEEIVKLDAGTIRLNNTEIVRLNKSLKEWELWKETL